MHFHMFCLPVARSLLCFIQTHPPHKCLIVGNLEMGSNMVDMLKNNLTNVVIGGGIFAAGIWVGRTIFRKNNFGYSNLKSFGEVGSSDPLLAYCINNSAPLHPVQEKLIRETLKHEWSVMMGAPEVIRMNTALIKALGTKKVIDVGVFTGASSLAAALALPPDGVVVACDVDEDFTKIARSYWREAGVEDKVQLYLDSAVTTLDSLIANGESGTFGFAFIDADKPNYDNYYERCLKLIRPGGIIAFDNTLWSGKVLHGKKFNDESTNAIRALNEKLAKDTDRVYVVQLKVGDGLTLAVRL